MADNKEISITTVEDENLKSESLKEESSKAPAKVESPVRTPTYREKLTPKTNMTIDQIIAMEMQSIPAVPDIRKNMVNSKATNDAENKAITEAQKLIGQKYKLYIIQQIKDALQYFDKHPYATRAKVFISFSHLLEEGQYKYPLHHVHYGAMDKYDPNWDVREWRVYTEFKNLFRELQKIFYDDKKIYLLDESERNDANFYIYLQKPTHYGETRLWHGYNVLPSKL